MFSTDDKASKVIFPTQLFSSRDGLQEIPLISIYLNQFTKISFIILAKTTTGVYINFKKHLIGTLNHNFNLVGAQSSHALSLSALLSTDMLHFAGQGWNTFPPTQGSPPCSLLVLLRR